MPFFTEFGHLTLNYVRGNAPAAPPGTIYLALYSDSVTSDKVGTEVTATITGGNRPSFTLNAPSAKQCENDPAITVTASAAGSANIVSVGIFNSATPNSGFGYFHADLPAPIPVLAGQSVTIPFEELVVILDLPC